MTDAAAAVAVRNKVRSGLKHKLLDRAVISAFKVNVPSRGREVN